MYVIVTDNQGVQHKSNVDVHPSVVDGLVEHLKQSPRVHRVDVYEDLSCLTSTVEDVLDTWVDMSLEDTLSQIDELILGVTQE